MATEFDTVVRLVNDAVNTLTRQNQDLIARLILLEEELAAHKKRGSECPHTATGGEADEFGNY